MKPSMIEKPRVRILNEHNDATKRQFPVGTVLEITCQGQIGSDPSNVRINTFSRNGTTVNIKSFTMAY